MTSDTIGDNIQWRAKQHDRKKQKMQGISEKKMQLLDGTVKGQMGFLSERAMQSKMILTTVNIDRFVKYSPDLFVKDSLAVVAASSALRCLDLIKHFKKDHENVAKLFAKHLKIADQMKFIEAKKAYIGVGTPQRIANLPIKPAVLIIDSSHVDQKKRTIFDHNDLRLDMLKCIEAFPDAKICLWDNTE